MQTFDSLSHKEKINIFKSFAGNKVYYNIMCVLRGDDTTIEEIKWIFTARIRHLVGVSESEVYTAIVRSRPHVSKIDVDILVNKLMGFGSADYLVLSHYLNHVMAAINSIGELGLMLPSECSALFDVAEGIISFLEGKISMETLFKRLQQLVDIVDGV